MSLPDVVSREGGWAFPWYSSFGSDLKVRYHDEYDD
jgi:hypothetical protein